MNQLREIHFWHLMVGTGFALLAIGLALIFLTPGVGDRGPFEIEFFEARIEGSEMGLALIVLGLSCFLIGRKDLADLRNYRSVQEQLGKTSSLAAGLVADQVTRAFNGFPQQPTSLTSRPDLDLEGTRREMKILQNGGAHEQTVSKTIGQTERGRELLKALEREGYSI